MPCSPENIKRESTYMLGVEITYSDYFQSPVVCVYSHGSLMYKEPPLFLNSCRSIWLPAVNKTHRFFFFLISRSYILTGRGRQETKQEHTHFSKWWECWRKCGGRFLFSIIGVKPGWLPWKVTF